MRNKTEYKKLYKKEFSCFKYIKIRMTCALYQKKRFIQFYSFSMLFEGKLKISLLKKKKKQTHINFHNTHFKLSDFAYKYIFLFYYSIIIKIK